MLRIRTRKHVLFGTAISVLVAVLLVMLHVEINYPVEIRDLVRVKAAAVTVVVTVGIASFSFSQLRKTYLLTLQLQRLLDHDRLTNVSTRDYFFNRMAADGGHDGVSLMVDIDYFKQINDTYGHLVGDDVIKEVAGVLKANTRSDDIICRFGGEEFVIFLSGQAADEGFAVAERMREEICAERIKAGDTYVSVTISIGGARKESDTNIVESIRQADTALYLAKNGGRNRTVFENCSDAHDDIGDHGLAMAQ